MKKLVFCASALLFTGIMFAQSGTINNGTLTTSKATTAVDADEIAPLGVDVGQNSGLSVQNGNTNKVQVLQAGVNNSVYSQQADGLGTGDNRARIWQTGNVNGNTANSGERNNADVRQVGTMNQADIGQEGDLNEAVVQQGLKESSLGLSEGNKVRINHGISENGESNYAMAEQDGKDNSSKIIQVYDNNQARTVQEGDNNIMDVRQHAGPNQSAGHLAIGEQYGNDNSSKIRQWGDNQNEARTVQVGDNNKINQRQTSNGGTGVGNKAAVNQGGDILYYPPNISDTFAIWDTDLQALDNTQNGSFNPGSTNARALQVQEGNDNEALAWQFGDNNYSEQNQDGEENDATVFQNAYGSANGNTNYARQDQDGIGNSAGISQNGRDHQAYQRQYGDNNEVLSSQRGVSNRVSTYQSGDDNIGHTAQRGNNNTILLVQKQELGYAGHSYKVTQNLPNGSPVGQPNGGNIADILQLGPSGGVGENCDFQLPEVLDCPSPLNGFDIANPCDQTTPGGC